MIKKEMLEKIKKMNELISSKTYKKGYSLYLKENDKHLPSPSSLMKSLSTKMYDKISNATIFRIIKKAISEDNELILNKLKEFEVFDKYVVKNANGNINKLVSTMIEKLNNDQLAEVFFIKYSTKGTIIHEAIEDTLENNMLIQPQELEEEFNKNWLAFEKFYNQNQIDPLAIELRVINAQKGHSGVIDFVGSINSSTYIIDWKTNSEINIHYVAIQLYFYKMALESNDIKIDNLAVVHLKKDGNYKIIELDKKMFPIYKLVCESLLNVNSFVIDILKK